LGSANGTFVNGRRLAPQAAVQLRSGDELKCGTMVFRVEIGI
jgi:predicted component of type VI protein secretion system